MSLRRAWNLYIDVALHGADGASAEVESRQYHSNLTRIKRNGMTLLSKDEKISTSHREEQNDR